MSVYPSDERGQNWMAFVAVLFFVVGAFNMIDGIAALVEDDYFSADELLFGDLSMWGAFYLIIGATQIVAAFLILRGSVVGALLGITLAALNAVIALLSIGAYPVWSVIILVLDGIVIYALTVHGDALRTSA